jgi:hypothetical protein
VWVIQRRQRSSLATETAHPLSIASELKRQCFEGDITTEFGVVRPIDLSHAAHSQGRHDEVMAKLLTYK